MKKLYPNKKANDIHMTIKNLFSSKCLVNYGSFALYKVK